MKRGKIPALSALFLDVRSRQGPPLALPSPREASRLREFHPFITPSASMSYRCGEQQDWSSLHARGRGEVAVPEIPAVGGKFNSRLYFLPVRIWE